MVNASLESGTDLARKCLRESLSGSDALWIPFITRHAVSTMSRFTRRKALLEVEQVRLCWLLYGCKALMILCRDDGSNVREDDGPVRGAVLTHRGGTLCRLRMLSRQVGTSYILTRIM